MFTAGPGRNLYFFYCQGRGRAGIKNFEMTGAGPGLEKLKMPGPGPSQDRNFFYCRGRAGIYFFYCRGRAGIEIFFIAGAGPGFNFFIAGAGPGRDHLRFVISCYEYL